MDKPLPKPLPAHTWTASHLGKLKAEALKLGGAPEVEPKLEDAQAFAADLPYRFPHVREASYNADHKRVEVKLHGGLIAFHVPVSEAKGEGEAA